MNKFKVRYVEKDTGYLKYNNIYEATEYDYDSTCYKILKDEWGAAGAFFKTKFEVVEELETNEQLLDILNKGIEAKNELIKRNKLQQSSTENFTWRDCTYSPWKYRLKNKEFKSFVIGKNWNVKIINTTLHIGCEKWDAKASKLALENLLYKNHVKSPRESWLSTRNGIKYNDHLLSWENAEQLYNALKEYLE